MTALLTLSLITACSDAPLAPLAFEDVTPKSGLEALVGMTHGVAWGDVDGDGLPDLYLTNHLNPPQLLRNLGGGRFEDLTQTWFDPTYLDGDSHGAAWADLDNDGRLDLVQLTGAKMGVGEEPKRLFINQGARFEEVAEALGVLNPQGRTRMPLWLDVDGDGKLDLIQGAETRFDDLAPPFTFLQRGSRFEQTLEGLAFRSRTVPFCIVTELDNDHFPEAVCRVAGNNLSAQIFSTRTQPATELDLLPVSAFEDIAAGDFDNDGNIDLFLARRNPSGKVAFGRPADNALIADLTVKESELAQGAEFSFRTKGKLKLVVAPKLPRGLMTLESVRVGAKGQAPEALDFVLDPASPEAAGIAAGPAAQPELRIGFEAPDRWRVALAGPERADENRNRNVQIQLSVSADEAISDVKAPGDAERAEHAPQRLFMNRGGKLVEESDKRGVNKTPIAAMNVVAADFNNDMLLDLFILGSGDVGMHDSLLLINQGGGKFKAQSLGDAVKLPRAGVGDSVTTADFDGDGFVDLLIATGGSMGRSLGLPSDNGSYRLLRNTGNGNGWLQIDLEGTRSNRDGIGARVFVTAGGVTQTRVQDGGIHHRSQNHSRLHFGLGKHDKVEKISVQWPSGVRQDLLNVPANQTLMIREQQ
ncbi:MAG TPA: CRTAC1 family protein [Azoarcus taiwanensis]|nr:CRTAC1 family protein [Azoarcus taiwanensis]